MSRRKKRFPILEILLIVGLVTLTVAAGTLAYITRDNPPTTSTPSVSEPPTLVTPPPTDTPPTTAPAMVVRPTDLRAIYLTPGDDYSLTDSEESIKADINAALGTFSGYTMNAVVINTVTADGKVLLPSATLPQYESSFDIVAYIIDAARQLGLYSYVVYPICDTVIGDAPTGMGIVTGDTIDKVKESALNFTSLYSPTGVMLDGYYHLQNEYSYTEYLGNGGAMGFESYTATLSHAVFEAASTTLRQGNPSLHVGMVTESVWANDTDNESGSATSAEFSTLYTGNSDNVKFLEYGFADFVAVKAFGAITDTVIPYTEVVSWWADAAANYSAQLYVIHAADKVATSEDGWSEYDQLPRQLIESQNLSSFSGSMYNSFSNIEANPKDFATMLTKYYNGELNPEHVSTDLDVTKPESRTFQTYEPTVTFSGASDPNLDVMINNTTVTTDENGYFTTTLQLDPSINTFDIVHKGSTITYTITRIVQVVREVSPTGTLNIEGGTELTITATAYEDSDVYATLGDRQIELYMLDTESDELANNSSYRRYEGVFTMPEPTLVVQDLGNIEVHGEWSGFEDSMEGANVQINARPKVSEGTPIMITADSAATYPTNVLNQYGSPDYLPLPYGAVDYIVSNKLTYSSTQSNGSVITYHYYNLESGVRVNADDITTIPDSQAVGYNEITDYDVYSDSRYTTVVVYTEQPVSYSAKYDTDSFSIDFNFTSSAPTSKSTPNNEMFSSVSWAGTTLHLDLLDSGRFIGYDAHYADDGSLVLRFNNPPSDVSEATIVIDPGHGVGDPGALGFISAYPERWINWNVANKFANELRNMGAEVIVLNTNAYQYTLDQRVEMANDYDPHLFISIHSNSATYSGPVGTEAYYYNPWSNYLARLASWSTASALSTVDRGGKFGNYIITKSSEYPSILLEMGFVCTESEYSKLISDSYQNAIARNLADTVETFFENIY